MESFKNQIKGKKKTEKIKFRNILETNGPFWKWFFFSFLGSREGYDKSTNIQKTPKSLHRITKTGQSNWKCVGKMVNGKIS